MWSGDIKSSLQIHQRFIIQQTIGLACMMAFTPFTGAVFVAHLVAGIVLGYSLLRIIESSIPLAAVYGMLFTGIVVAVDRWIGKMFIEFQSWSEFEAVVMAAVLGGLLGVVLTVVLLEPEPRRMRRNRIPEEAVEKQRQENDVETEVAD